MDEETYGENKTYINYNQWRPAKDTECVHTDS